MNIFKVAYDPDISKEAKTFIRNEINYSMVSNDESTMQYPVDFVLNYLIAYGDIHEDDKYEKDVEYLNNLDVDYIEF